ncbi:hypothetical protein F5B21DRAFT_493775 [Xylaria acuta]|nr:hypothetical protein F5B21DRAFT_493775 [Xylaria acuta]
MRNAQDRHRKTALACEPCRERKIRCDGGKPVCSACQRRRLPLEQCLYTIKNTRTVNRDVYNSVMYLIKRARSLTNI